MGCATELAIKGRDKDSAVYSQLLNAHSRELGTWQKCAQWQTRALPSFSEQGPAMPCALCSEHCAVCSLQSIVLCCVQCAMCTVQCGVSAVKPDRVQLLLNGCFLPPSELNSHFPSTFHSIVGATE